MDRTAPPTGLSVALSIALPSPALQAPTWIPDQVRDDGKGGPSESRRCGRFGPSTYAMSNSPPSPYSRPTIFTARDKGMDAPSWTCLGEGAEHPVDLAHVELLLDRGGTEVSVQRCRACGQLYRFERFELNDWSGGGDYCDRTSIWKALEPDEVERVRADLNYRPRGGRQHRFDTGWKREGP